MLKEMDEYYANLLAEEEAKEAAWLAKIEKELEEYDADQSRLALGYYEAHKEKLEEVNELSEEYINWVEKESMQYQGYLDKLYADEYTEIIPE